MLAKCQQYLAEALYRQRKFTEAKDIYGEAAATAAKVALRKKEKVGELSIYESRHLGNFIQSVRKGIASCNGSLGPEITLLEVSGCGDDLCGEEQENLVLGSLDMNE